MEFSHANNSGGKGGADGQGKLNINYGELRSIGDYLVDRAEAIIAGYTTATEEANESWLASTKPLVGLSAANTMAIQNAFIAPGFGYRNDAGSNFRTIGKMLQNVADLCEAGEQRAIGHNYSHTTMHHFQGDASAVTGFAAGYYTQAVADRDQAEADRIAAEQQAEADRKAEEKAAEEQAKREAEKAAKLAAMLAFIGQVCPEAAEELQWKMWDAQMQEAIDYYENGEGNDPEFAAQLREEWEAKKKAREEAKRAEEEAVAAAERERTLEWLRENSPEAYGEYLKRLAAEDEEAALAWLKENDPELYEAAMKERAAAAKAAREAAKAAEEAQAGGISDDVGSGWADASDGGIGGGSDWSSDLGGGSGLSGGGGGLGGFDDASIDGGGLGSDWGSEDWASDMLDDAVDTGELSDAGSALDGITGSGLDGALGTSLEDAAAEGEAAATGFWAEHGAQISEAAQRYGVQAGLMLGGAAALYLTREQTTEAVAHVAEFVSTKCKPAVDDVMDQVRGAAKKTRVSVSNATSGIKSAARGEGDLIG